MSSTRPPGGQGRRPDMRSIEPRNRHDRGTQGNLLSQRRGLLAALDVHPHRRHDGRLPRPAGYRRQARNIEVAKGVTTFAIMSGAAGYDGAREQMRPLTDRTLQMADEGSVLRCALGMDGKFHRCPVQLQRQRTKQNGGPDRMAGSGNRNQITEWFVVAGLYSQGGGSQAHPGNPPNQDALQYLTKTPSATEAGPEPTDSQSSSATAPAVLQKVESAHPPPPRLSWKAVRN